uniref:Uncharacterized protein n=1 Tax=Setaria italica TaxID=4555 RepID=K4ANH1_SETIT
MRTTPTTFSRYGIFAQFFHKFWFCCCIKSFVMYSSKERYCCCCWQYQVNL